MRIISFFQYLRILTHCRCYSFIKKEYGNPTVIITENGWADSGGLDDIGRQTFLATHLQSVLDAIWDDGCRVNGHFTWALIDTFEFGLGYTLVLIHSTFNRLYSASTNDSNSYF